MGKIVKNEIILEGGRAFRVGGDEVVYWFPGATRAKQVLESIGTKLQLHPFILGGETRKRFSISFGIGLDAISADRELYFDKEFGQSVYVMIVASDDEATVTPSPKPKTAREFFSNSRNSRLEEDGLEHKWQFQ